MYVHVVTFACTDSLSIHEGSPSKERFHGTHGALSRSATVEVGYVAAMQKLLYNVHYLCTSIVETHFYRGTGL